MENANTYPRDNAHKLKLTAVSIGHGDNRIQMFVYLWHDEKGNPKLPVEMLDKAMKDSK